MTEHEIARLAAALNQARPDWPTKQLVTLMSDPRMAHRPRRDVFVALAWVACEAASASPYRVLEAGPWWRAAAVEGQAHVRDVAPVGSRCTTCGETEARCRGVEHTFSRPIPRDADLGPVVAELKAHIDPRPSSEGAA